MTFLGSILVCCGMFACSRDSRVPTIEPAPYTQPPVDVDGAASSLAPSTVTFLEITRQAGIQFQHETGAFGEKWMPETMGSGCALFDYDRDGDQDLLLINGNFWEGREKEGPTPVLRLYGNLGNATFEEVTEQAELGVSLYGMGCAVGDYDGDGDPDLFVTAVGDNVLFRNEGRRFVDVTGTAGIAGASWESELGKVHPEWSTGSAWVDVDGDGWLDLFVCNYVQWSPETDLFTTIDGVSKSYATPQQYKGSTCRLYRNRGDGTFEEITERAGVFNPNGKSMAVAVSDFNDDGSPDLVVTNDTQPDFLYRNRGDGTFEEIGLASGIAYDETGRARAGMGVDVGALDEDGVLAIAIGNFSREPVSLYLQAWEDIFIDQAGGRQIAQPTLLQLTFGLVFFDYDLDGALDLALANGHLEPEVNRVQKDIRYAQLPQLFWNTGQGGFHDVTDRSGSPFKRPVVGRGLAYGDLDGDGDLDLVLTTSGSQTVVMRNEGPVGHAIRVQLHGSPPNRDAIGARATTQVGKRTRRAWVRSGGSYLSQSEMVLTFGLGTRGSVDQLSVKWPTGPAEAFENLEAGVTYVIEEGKGIVERIPFRVKQTRTEPFEEQ